MISFNFHVKKIHFYFSSNYNYFFHSRYQTIRRTISQTPEGDEPDTSFADTAAAPVNIQPGRNNSVNVACKYSLRSNNTF